MEHIIQNEFLRVAVSEHGAELQSVCTKDGTEYLWQGDPAFWNDRAPTLFPYVGRLPGKTYFYENKPYRMDIHGFAPTASFRAEELGPERVRFLLSDSPETLAQYPFRFGFEAEYALEGNRLTVTYRVENRDDKIMYFGLGGHPGFRVPLEEGKQFGDYRLEFDAPCQPVQVLFCQEDFLTTGEEVPYPLVEGRILPLRHKLFDEDALVLKNTAHQVKLCCPGGTRSVTFSFQDFPIFGMWHALCSEAPYVCLEPWSSLPSRHGGVTHLEQQEDLIALEPGKTYVAAWSAEIQ